jgi:hypothetical protein
MIEDTKFIIYGLKRDRILSALHETIMNDIINVIDSNLYLRKK